MEAVSTTKLTYADYAALPEDGRRYELIHGELVELSSPTDLHQMILGRLHLAIGAWLATHKGGRLRFAPLDVILDDYNCLQPDVLYVAPEQIGVMRHEGLRGAPSLAVEVLSPSTARRDLRVKRDLYDASGVLEYWIVDPVSQRIEVYRSPFGKPELLESPETLRSSLLPEFGLDLEALFAPED